MLCLLFIFCLDNYLRVLTSDKALNIYFLANFEFSSQNALFTSFSRTFLATEPSLERIGSINIVCHPYLLDAISQNKADKVLLFLNIYV